MLVNLIVVVQVVSMAALAVAWWKTGDSRLAIAQVCYCVSTIVLFAKT